MIEQMSKEVLLKQRLEGWLDANIELCEKMEALKECDKFHTYHTTSTVIDGKVEKKCLHVSDVVGIGKILGIEVHEEFVPDSKYPYHYHMHYKDWILFCISEESLIRE